MGFGRGIGFTIKTTPTSIVIELAWGRYTLLTTLYKTTPDHYVANSIDLEEQLTNPTYEVS